MIADPIELLDVVALLIDLPEHGLQRGQVGTVVEVLPPDAYEVEFVDRTGRTLALLPLPAAYLLLLHELPLTRT
jgi:hypothetical protein